MLTSSVSNLTMDKSRTSFGQHKERTQSMKSDSSTKKRQYKGSVTLKQLRMRLVYDDPMYMGLKKIKISGKELTNLPASLFQLTELEVLDLSPEREACLFYHLTSLPSQVANLVNLTVLALDTNKLTSLPDSIGELSCLERLALSNNLLTSLPPTVANLTSLRSLYCANNQFEQFPMELCYLSGLVFLDFSDNKLPFIPEEIGQMEGLQSLILSYNNIEYIPETISYLKNLEMLWLCGNQLRSLPKGIGKLPKLDWSWLNLSSAFDGNPLEHPPLSVAKQGPEAIEKYLSLHKSNVNGHMNNPVPQNSRRRYD